MPFNKLREYSGKGKFEFKMKENLTIESNFNINFFSNARVIVETSILLSPSTGKIIKENKKELLNISLNGIITDVNGDTGTISIEGMFITSMNISAQKGEITIFQLEFICFSIVDIIYSDEKSRNVEIHYGLTNFIFSGCTYSEDDGKFLLDKFDANINNINFLFKKVEGYKEFEKRLKETKGCYITSEAIVNVSIAEREMAKSTIFDIIELLSLATRNFVSPVYEDHFYNGELIRTILNPVLTKDYNAADNLIDSNRPNPCILQIFLESTYDKYQEFKDILGLNSVIHLHLISRYAFFTESKFLLAVVSLESLLSYFEEYLKDKNKPIKPSSVGRTKKSLAKEFEKEGIQINEEILERIASSVAYTYPTFNDKLISLLKEFNIKYNYKDLELINLRNKIVHSGKFPDEFNSRIIDPHEEETRLVYFLDKILLSILDYKNKPFLNIFNQYKEEKLS